MSHSNGKVVFDHGPNLSGQLNLKYHFKVYLLGDDPHFDYSKPCCDAVVAAAVAVPTPLLRHTADSAAVAAGWIRSEKAYPHSSRQSFVPCLTVAVEDKINTLVEWVLLHRSNCNTVYVVKSQVLSQIKLWHSLT